MRIKVGKMSQKFDFSKIKKSDWIVLALIGAILLVIVLPETDKESKVLENKTMVQGKAISEGAENSGEENAKDYASYLEKKLEDALREMEGVGRVKVMITVSDNGEAVVEKDTVDISNSVRETDKNGGNKDTLEREIQSETVHIENENGTYPYIEKELLPTIEGILVIAEGGGNAVVVSQISKAAQALFPVEAHKIIVVKMSQGG